MKQLLLILALSIAINAQEAHYVGDKSCQYIFVVNLKTHHIFPIFLRYIE